MQKDHLRLLPSLSLPALQYKTKNEGTDYTVRGRANDLCYQTQGIYLLQQEKVKGDAKKAGKRSAV